MHDPPGLEVRDNLLDDVADLVNLLIKLLLRIQELAALRLLERRDHVVADLQARAAAPLREALRDLMSAAGLVRRIGTNLNQAVARLNATGQPGEDLVPSAEFCVRVIQGYSEIARRSHISTVRSRP